MNNEKDFESIYKNHQKIIYFYLLSLSQNSSLAEELTQETLFRGITNINTFREDCKISTWLCKIAKNLFLDWQKKSTRTIPMDEKHLPSYQSPDFLSTLEDKETASQILKIIHQLDNPYKEVFILHALGDISLKQISELFSKSDSWGRVTYYRAKAIILDKLKEENKDD